VKRRTSDRAETPEEAPLRSDRDVIANGGAAAVRSPTKTCVATWQLLLPVPEVRTARRSLDALLDRHGSGAQPSGSRQSGSTPAPEVPRLLLSVAEAARTLGICRSSLYTLLDRRRLRSVSIGRRRLIPAEAVREFVDSLIPNDS
jgi:excisionase family DNA binding protein